ncbi:hypothetical protein J2736_002728, partial [Paenibacillus qinlingensis]|nr:hypothetical protein [Paenibacillus qinlingensis]
MAAGRGDWLFLSYMLTIPLAQKNMLLR